MSFCSAAIQKAVVDALKVADIPGVNAITDSPLSGDGLQYPIIQIGDSQAIPDHVSCSDGSQEFLKVHVWSRQAGQREAKEIMGAIWLLFDGQLLTVDGLASCSSFVDSDRLLEDPDGITRHGVVSLTFNCRKE